MELLFKQLCKYTILGGYNLSFTDKNIKRKINCKMKLYFLKKIVITLCRLR